MDNQDRLKDPKDESEIQVHIHEILKNYFLKFWRHFLKIWSQIYVIVHYYLLIVCNLYI